MNSIKIIKINGTLEEKETGELVAIIDVIKGYYNTVRGSVDLKDRYFLVKNGSNEVEAFKWKNDKLTRSIIENSLLEQLMELNPGVTHMHAYKRYRKLPDHELITCLNEQAEYRINEEGLL
ncbi:hypothetical protein [Pseudalkalibacillus caeni]|uniref:Uncharacterized protein n=1 Tax=Exobacillus caeni TaxID=2574798 RepID=A0A5R9F073_9BACL|nr:hypothetical protein [Pseudalkalibacillus caeni]TLS36089.1 hypothetical protein FCL54_17020 [Pseudalkalibacillus caeni]